MVLKNLFYSYKHKYNKDVENFHQIKSSFVLFLALGNHYFPFSHYVCVCVCGSLIFLPAVLIPVCNSFSLASRMICSL